MHDDQKTEAISEAEVFQRVKGLEEGADDDPFVGFGYPVAALEPGVRRLWIEEMPETHR